MGAKSFKINKSKARSRSRMTQPGLTRTCSPRSTLKLSGEIKLNDYKNIYAAGSMGKVWPKTIAR